MARIYIASSWKSQHAVELLTVALRVHIRAVIGPGRLAVDRDAKPDRLRWPRAHDQVGVACVKPHRELCVGALGLDILGLQGPGPLQGPRVQ